MVNDMPDTELQLVDFTGQQATDEQLDRLMDLQLARRREYFPGDPEPTRDAMLRGYRAPTAGWDEMWVAAVRDGRFVGYGGWDVDVEDNPHQLWVGAYVLPENRRQGIGSRIVAQLVETAARHAPKRVGFSVAGHVAIGREIQDLVENTWGLDVRMEERVSRLALAEVDREAVAAALAERLAQVADRYRLLFFELDDLPGPETGLDVDDFLGMVEEIVNLMPLEGFQLEPESYTPERFRAQVARQRAQGRTIWNTVMLERATGECAGITNICFDPADPRKISQYDTGVRAAHQRRGLGKALKLHMLDKVLAEVPGAAYIDTENANSNAAMLAINDALGFREHHSMHGYQLDIDRFRELVAGSGTKSV